MKRFIDALCAVVVACALAACGGGGGGGAEAPRPALSFSPGALAANVQEGTSATLTVRATAADATLFQSTIYVQIEDSAGLLTQSVELGALDSRTVSATLHTRATLLPGRHQGSFQVYVCRDPNCTAQVAGSPVALPYDLTVTPAPLQATPLLPMSLTVHRGGSLFQTLPVQVAAPGQAWTASSTAGWLRVDGGSGIGFGEFRVAFITAGLPEGEHTATVDVRSADGQAVGVPVTLQVLPAAFVVGGGVPTFAAVNGASIPAWWFGLEVNNNVPTSWAAQVSRPWLAATPTSGTTPAQVSLQPDPSIGALASGVHEADVTLSAAGLADKVVTARLELTKATLQASSATLTLGGTKGRDLAAAQQVVVALNTGTRAWPYTLSTLPAWLSSPTMTGQVDGLGTPVSLQPTGLVTPGSRTATVTVTAAVNGDTVSLPLTVNVNADQRRLLPSAWGVGLAATPTGSVLARTIAIADNFGGNLAWTATSSAPWLAVTAGGSTGAGTALVLTAQPASLANGSVSIAEVTVATATAGVQPAVIRVGLYKSSTGLASIARLAAPHTVVVADRVRPYVYAHDGGTSIDVYHAYTAQKIATIANVGAALGRMATGPDGATLYALDTAAKSVVVVDLATRTVGGGWPLDLAVNTHTSVVALKPNGVELVLLGDGTAYAGGRSLGQTPVANAFSATADGSRVLAFGGALYTIDHSQMSGGLAFTDLQRWVQMPSGGNLQDVAISPDGTRAYSASGGGTFDGYKCSQSNAATGAFIGSLPGGDAYPNNVEVTADGRAICGISGWYAASDFWVYSPAGAIVGSHKVAGYARALLAGQLVVTPDGLVVVALTDDPVIAFVPIGAP